MKLLPLPHRKELRQHIARRSELRSVSRNKPEADVTAHPDDTDPVGCVAELLIGATGALVLDEREEVVVEVERNVTSTDDEERDGNDHPARCTLPPGSGALRATEPGIHARREGDGVNAECNALHEQRG